MSTRPRRVFATFTTALFAASACTACARTATPAGTREPPETQASANPAGRGATNAAAENPNVRFMRDMIAHHQQALTMAALAEQHAGDPTVKTLARRIDASQTAEIARMHRWLTSHGHDTTTTHTQHAGHAMPGMLTDQELNELADASGSAFDRLFTESMIRHHEGALIMVAELLAAGGGRDDVEVFQLASQIDADQRAEIERMRRLLAQLR